MRRALLLVLALAGCGEPTATPSEVAQDLAAAGGAPELPERFGLGRPPTDAEVRAWDIDVDAQWAGLPVGRGSAAEGQSIYAQKCASCHGVDAKAGDGYLGPSLVATEPLEGLEKSWRTPRSIGNWWPYASTLFDYVRRAMPQTMPGSLTDDETYALTAWLLAENGVIPRDAALDQQSIRAVVMPTRVTFKPDDRLSTTSFR